MTIFWPGSKSKPIPATEKSSVIPILVGGCPFSGVQLMGAILGSHPSVYSVRPVKTEDESATSNKKNNGFSRVFDVQISSLPEDYSHWCEASPANILYTDDIIETLGADVRILNIVRDARDVVFSSRPGRGSWRSRVSPERWLDYIAAGRRVGAYPQVMTIRYEDIITHYDDVIAYVCQFIGLEPVEELMRFPGSKEAGNQREWFLQRDICDDCSPIGGWMNASADASVVETLHHPQIKPMLKYYMYLPGIKQILLGRLKQTLRHLFNRLK
jgi:hypothetical protein